MPLSLQRVCTCGCVSMSGVGEGGRELGRVLNGNIFFFLIYSFRM